MDEKNNKWKWEVITKLITSMGFIATILYGYYEFKLSEENKKKEQKFQEQQDLVYRQFELYKTFWEKRFEVYVDTCNSAATLSTFIAKLSKANEKTFPVLLANKPKTGFWQLYYGALSIVEDKDVEKALLEFGDALQICEAKIAKSEQPTFEDGQMMKRQSLLLGLACRSSISHYWKTLEEIDRVRLKEFEEEKMESTK